MTPIYHITHISNLPAILAGGGLVCDAEVERRGLCRQSIAYDTIKERRRKRQVSTLAGIQVGAGGVVADYVPFYFTNRSPMLGAIHHGNVPGYQEGQRDVVYLVSGAEAVAASGCQWCFTDGHAVEGMTQFFGNLKDLEKVNWDAVQTWRWGGRHQLVNPDVLRRKQAEFLVHNSFPWVLIHSIGVLDAAMVAQVRGLLATSAHKPKLSIEPNWYYN